MTIVALIATLLASAPVNAAPAVTSRPATASSPAAISPEELFSRRALRRARLLIQMRMLQLRDERLECVREALTRQLPSALWAEQPSPSRGTSSAAVAAARCSQLLTF
jgi:hypothetical protein